MIGSANPHNTAERLRKRAADEIHVVQDPLRFGTAKARGPIGAERVRLVDEQIRAVLAAGGNDFPERRDVAANRIQTLYDDKAVPVAMRQPLELSPEAV